MPPHLPLPSPLTSPPPVCFPLQLDFEATAGEALVAAAESGHVECVSLLLDSDASVNGLSGRALQRACAANQLPTASLLLAHSADPTLASSLTAFTPLMHTCKATPPAPPSLPALLPPPITIDATAALSPTFLSSRLQPSSAHPPGPILALLSPSHSSATPAPMASTPATAAGPASASHRSPRGAGEGASTSGSRVPLMRLLLSFPSCESTVNAACSGVYCGPYNGWAALHFAADNDRVDLCEELIARGADVDAKTGQGDTALAIAAERGHAQVVHALVGYRADIHAQRVSAQAMAADGVDSGPSTGG